jgi:hypothetical protein
MQISNVRYYADGAAVAADIDGMSYSGIRVDAIAARDGEIACLIADWMAKGGEIAPYVPPPVSADDFAAAIQAHVDATAKARGYADGVALAGYSASTIPTWSAEAAAFIAWRDQVWLYASDKLAKVQSGQTAPTIEEFLAELPAIVWPQS